MLSVNDDTCGVCGASGVWCVRSVVGDTSGVCDATLWLWKFSFRKDSLKGLRNLCVT